MRVTFFVQANQTVGNTLAFCFHQKVRDQQSTAISILNRAQWRQHSMRRSGPHLGLLALFYVGQWMIKN